MAFEASVILVKEPCSAALAQRVISALSSVMQQKYTIGIVKILDHDEYEKNTSSKEINKYIRVRRKDLEKQEGEFELVKVGKGKYSTEQFASAKLAFMSISQMGEYSVCWFSFHSRLRKALPKFDDLLEKVTKSISSQTSTETIFMRATSASRNKDLFVLYIRGRERSLHAGKAALTDVKNMYKIDINRVMDNVDQNIAIFYAPVDFAEVTKDLAEHRRRVKAFAEKRDGLLIKDKEDGSDLVEQFDDENAAITQDLEHKMHLVETAMKAEPIGSLVFFKMDQVTTALMKLSINERLFGRKV